MIFAIYKRALHVLMKKPLILWGISLLHVFLSVVVTVLFGTVLGVALGIILLLNTSMTMIYLHGYRGESVSAVQLFDCFKDLATTKRVLGGMAWMILWAFLWCLIPIAGPILFVIKLYEYRLTPYILITEPEIRATEAMKVSSQRTKGWKGKMFGADILLALAAAAVVLVLGLLTQIPYIGNLFSALLLLFTVVWCVLSPLYTGLIQAAFYEEIRNPTYVPRPRRFPNPYGGYTDSTCPHCGAPLVPNSNFCCNCGERLS